MSFSRYTRQMVRKRIERNLPDEAEIVRPSNNTVNDYGDPVAGLPTRYPTRCYLAKMGRSEAEMIAEADQSRIYYQANFPFDVEIADGDYLLVNDVRYEIVQIMERHSNSVMVQAIVVRGGS